MTNTCTIDNFLFSFWVLFKIVPDFIESKRLLNHTETIIEIIENIQNYNWNKAKELWILKVMLYNGTVKDNSISLFGSESTHFLDYLSEYQEHKFIQSCQISCQKNGKDIRDDSDKIFFKNCRNKIYKYSGFFKKCRKVNQK